MNLGRGKLIAKPLGVLAGVLVCTVLTTASNLHAQDKVYQLAGTTLSGEISSLTQDEIVISVRGKPQNVATNNVLRVSFDSEPSSFTRAKEFASQGQWEQAEEELKTVDPKSLGTPNLQQDYLFYRAAIAGQLALAGKGTPNQPAAGLLAYARANPKSHHFYELCEIVGGLASAMNSYGDAKKYYGAIANAPFPEYKLRSAYLVGTVALAEGKADEAKAEFEKAKSMTVTDPIGQRYQKLATVAVIRTDIVKGDAKGAVSQLLKLAEASDSADSSLFANIYNALGEAHLALSEPNNAKLAYLHTDLMFASDAEKHAEALYHLGRLWEQTGDPQRAVDAKTRLKEQYGSSIWAKK